MKQIGIYGGSFNPVHYGHLIVAQSVLDQLDLDKIIFIPNGYNPFKSSLSKQERKNCLKMLRESISDNPNFEINTIEIDQKGKKFSYNTVRELQKLNPDTKFYFIIGSDILKDLEKWYKIEQLLKLTNFIVVNRNNKEESIEKINSLNSKFHTNIKFIDIPEIEISSTFIRNKLKTNQSIKYLTPDKVVETIKNKNLYINNKKFSKLIKKIKQYLKENLKKNRYEHSLNVMQTAQKLALKYNCDLDKAQLAGLVHDCAKSMTIDEMIKYAKKNNFYIPDDFLNNPPTLHAIVGTLLAQNLFNIKDNEILNAIKNHTTGDVKMSNLDKIIYLADYIEPGREGDYVNKVRELAEVDLNKAVLLAMENTCNYLKENNKIINQKTIDAKNYLEEEINNKNE